MLSFLLIAVHVLHQAMVNKAGRRHALPMLRLSTRSRSSSSDVRSTATAAANAVAVAITPRPDSGNADAQAAAKVSAIATGPRPPPSSEPGTVGTDEPLRIELGDGPGVTCDLLRFNDVLSGAVAVVRKHSMHMCQTCFCVGQRHRQRRRLSVCSCDTPQNCIASMNTAFRRVNPERRLRENAHMQILNGAGHRGHFAPVDCAPTRLGLEEQHTGH